MPKYRVEITETLQYQEIISARNEQEALDKLKAKYRNEDIALDESNHVDTKFSVIEKVKSKEEHLR